MVRGDQITAENFADFLKRLTGKEMSEQGMTRLRAIVARLGQKESRPAPSPRHRG
jgi:hypothetical protein